MGAKVDIEKLSAWKGRSETLEDVVTTYPVAAMSATLDRDDPKLGHGDVLPDLWHWMYFLPVHRQSEIGPDGHARRGGFLPPVELPRRMWAGSRFEFRQPLRVGDTIKRTSTIFDVTAKSGATGQLVFVSLRHEISSSSGGSFTEEQDIVYRDMPNPGDKPPPPKPAPESAAWSRDIHPDEVLLFRYSALTFNGHRIHYDRKYVTEVEGYPGLIVHGPLIATLLVDLARRNEPRRLESFRFRAMSPLFDIAPFSVRGAPSTDGGSAKLWARNAAGGLAMEAEVGFADR